MASPHTTSYLYYTISFFLITLYCGTMQLMSVAAPATTSSTSAHAAPHTQSPAIGIDDDDDEYEDDDADTSDVDDDDDDETTDVQPHKASTKFGSGIINKIVIEGNSYVGAQAIAHKIPYAVGEVFEAHKTRSLIRNVHTLGYFKKVRVETEQNDDGSITLFVVVEEKPRLEALVFKGNKAVSEKDINKKINTESITAIDQEDLPKITLALKKLYREKDYHNPTIDAQLSVHDHRATATFTIKEGKKSLVKRVFFEGNCAFSDKKLRSLTFTREDWVFGFLNKAGSYQPEAIESDKHVIENFYQSNGYLQAKVHDVSVHLDEATKQFFVTFHIQEGDLYTISDIRVPGNEIISEELLQDQLPMKVGDIYSKEKIRQSIEMLRTLWGDFGYIYADIEPSIQPNDETKTVSIAFYSELGNQVTLRNINIIGNQKTRDKVIRRQLALQEGSLLTQTGMDVSRDRVELLGYFDQRNGVNWKINRIDKNTADLDLLLKEIKTGRLEGKVGFGGSPRDFTSPAKSFSLQLSVSENNLVGLGIKTNITAEFSKQQSTVNFNLTQPWLFDKPIYAAFDVYHKNSLYEEFKEIKDDIQEKLTGGSVQVGYVSPRLWGTKILGIGGVDGIHFSKEPLPKINAGGSAIAEDEFKLVLRRRFMDGQFIWLGTQWSQDIRNSPVHPSRGYQWLALTKVGFNGHRQLIEKQEFGFLKMDLDASWYTPLIGERDLVLCLHGHVGLVTPIKDRSIPFRELYHVGGPASVRGFTFGEIGPRWLTESIGGKKALWFNAELLFPIASDFSIKGALFYDGGAGWNSPDESIINPERLRNNKFDYRHAIGFGIRVLRPTPIQIDWGFKLDRRKGEKESEVHLSMYHEF